MTTHDADAADGLTSDAEIDAAIEGLNPLTGQSEDYIWRPADRARSILIALRDERRPSPQEGGREAALRIADIVEGYTDILSEATARNVASRIRAAFGPKERT